MENSKNLNLIYHIMTQGMYNSTSHPFADQLRNIGMPLDVPESLPITLNNNYIHRQDYRYDFIFNNPNVHSIIYNGVQYWLAKDIARELGYNESKAMVRFNVKPGNSIELSAKEVGENSSPTSM